MWCFYSTPSVEVYTFFGMVPITLKELTPYALHELVKAIYIEAPDKSSGKRRQNIHISYDFVGIIPIYELMQEEMA